MKTEIIIKDSFTILGRTTELNQAQQLQDNLIDNILWDFKMEKNSLHNKCYKDKIFSLYDYDPSTLREEDEDINYLYTVGIQTSDPNTLLPEGFVLKEIPSSKYAVFTHNISDNTLNGKNLSDINYEGKPISNIYDYIDGIWVIDSGYTLSSNPDFEIRDEANPHIVEYYISVK